MKYFLFFATLLLHTYTFAQDKTSGIYNVVQQMPEYPGGEDSMWKFIHANIRYPDSAFAHKIQGRIIIGFVVNEDGSLSDISIKKGLAWDINIEGMRVVKLLPHFRPGMQDGKAVKVNYTLPLTFTLKEDSGKGPGISDLYNKVDTLAEFPGGKKKMMEFINRNIKYPSDAELFNVQGTITVTFIVNEDGHLSNFGVPKGGDESLIKESMRVAKLMPPFKPAMKDGKAVKSVYSLPIGFKLDEVKQASDTAKLDKYPEFPGGDSAEIRFMQSHISYPPGPRERDIQGKVVVGFIVNEDGSLTDFRIVRSVQKELDAEAMRVAKLLPKFKPAMKNGKAVKAVFEFPISFKLSEKQQRY